MRRLLGLLFCLVSFSLPLSVSPGARGALVLLGSPMLFSAAHRCSVFLALLPAPCSSSSVSALSPLFLSSLPPSLQSLAVGSRLCRPCVSLLARAPLVRSSPFRPCRSSFFSRRPPQSRKTRAPSLNRLARLLLLARPRRDFLYGETSVLRASI